VNKLEVGKWYRDDNNDFIYINSIDGDTYDFTFVRNAEVYRDYWDCLNDKCKFIPLTLTPKKALILLGNKFTLRCVVSDKKFKLSKDGFIDTPDFNDLTIHALPSES